MKANQPAQLDLFQTAEEVPIYREDDLFIAPVRQLIRQAAETRRLIDHAGDIRDLDADSLGEQAFKQHQHQKAETLLAAARLLFDLRSASAFVPAIWGDWHVLNERVTDLKQLTDYAQGRPWWDSFNKVRDREKFFHWELEFPEVFFDDRRQGFDAVIGNPPWEKVLPNRHEFYSNYDILIRAFSGTELDQRIQELNAKQCNLEDSFIQYKSRINQIAKTLKEGGDFSFQDWIIDGKKSGGHQDLFKFFMERAYQIIALKGNVGLIVPSAFYSNEGCTGIRHLLLKKAEIRRFYGFENKKKIFPIHSSYKFVSLVYSKSNESSAFQAAFMRQDLDELSKAIQFPWMVKIETNEVRRLSPGNLTFLEYRNPRERKIILKMYEGNHLIVEKDSTFWGACFYQELNLTNDRDLWTNPKTGKLWSPHNVLGITPNKFDETRLKMAEKGFWPLYQDAHIHQYVLEFKPLMRWVSLEGHQKKYGKLPDASCKLVIRDPARNTDERTVIAAILPSQSCFGHTLNAVSIDQERMPWMLCILNSLCFDYLARKRVAGQHASPYLLARNAVPRPDQVLSAIRPVDQIHANESKMWIYDFEESWDNLWINEKIVAQSYGLDCYDLEFILETFPGLARKRPEFFAFLKVRLAEWKAEAGGQDTVNRPYPIAEDTAELPLAAERPQPYQTDHKTTDN